MQSRIKKEGSMSNMMKNRVALRRERERERDDSERMHCGLCANVKGERSTIKHYRLPVQCIQKCTVDLIGIKEVHSTCLKGKK